MDAALAAGGAVSQLTFGDQSFTFRSIDEMLKLRALMASALAAESGASTNYRVAATSKGV
jgi:hypothetical protein